MTARTPRPVVLASALGAALVLAAPPAVSGQEGPLDLTLENIFQVGEGGVRDAVLSPDGEAVAVVGEGPEGAGIYRIPVSGAEDPALVAEGSSPRWTPDGAGLVYASGGRLWRVEAAGGPPEAITGEVQGLRAPALSPDGSQIAFFASASGAQDVWVVPADGSGEPRQLTEQAMTVDDTRFAPAWSPDGSAIAYVGNAADYWSDDVWVVEVASGEERQISSGIMAISSTPAWSPDGSEIAVLGTDKDGFWFLDIADIYLLDPDGGREEKVEMQVYATAYRYQPFWSADGSRIYFPYQERGEHALWVVPVEGGVATRVTHVGGVLSDFSTDREVTGFAFVRESATEGAEAWWIRSQGGPERQLTAWARSFQGVEAPTEVSYRSFDGLYVQGFLYLPDAVEAGRVCPALVQVHGGGTNSYMNGLNLTEQYLAEQGYVVLAINYRGGSGFGRGFQSLGDEDWLNDQARDPGAAADYLRTLGYVNDEVGIYGYSYGGMQTMAAITRTPDKFDAAVPMAGIYSEAATFPLQDRLGKVFTRDGHGGLPEERPEIYEKSETLSRMDAITAPVLIMHGEEDVRAPFRNYELAVEALERYGKDYETATYPEGHGFRDPANRVDLYRNLTSFFGERLTGCQPGG